MPLTYHCLIANTIDRKKHNTKTKFDIVALGSRIEELSVPLRVHQISNTGMDITHQFSTAPYYLFKNVTPEAIQRTLLENETVYFYPLQAQHLTVERALGGGEKISVDMERLPEMVCLRGEPAQQLRHKPR